MKEIKMSKDLEKDFKEVSEKINAKLKEAAKAVSEASALSKEFGLKGSLIHTQFSGDFDLKIDEEYNKEGTIEFLFHQIDTSDLELALDMAGWNTSSSYC